MPRLNPDGNPKAVRSYKGAGGAAYPSVTEVLKVLEGEWMNAFLQRAGRREAARVMNEAAVLGTRVHDAAWRIAWDRRAKVDPDIRPFARAVREFLDAYASRVIVTELSMCSDRLGFGGTVDVLFEDHDGRLCLADYKTSAGGVTKTHKVQTAAYAMLARDAGYDVSKRYVVKLHKDDDRRGEWYAREATAHRENVAVFKSCLVVWRFLYSSRLENRGKTA